MFDLDLRFRTYNLITRYTCRNTSVFFEEPAFFQSFRGLEIALVGGKKDDPPKIHFFFGHVNLVNVDRDGHFLDLQDQENDRDLEDQILCHL